MTVLASHNRVDHIGNGVTSTFSFDFPLLLEAELFVFVDGVLKALSTHYTLVGEADPGGGPQIFPDGGDVVFGAGSIPASAAKILIIRTVPFTQTSEYPVGGKFPSRTHETNLDRLTMEVQQLAETDRRTVKLNASDVLTGEDYSLPLSTPAARAGKVFGFNATGDGLLLAENTIMGAAASAAAADASATAAAASAAAALASEIAAEAAAAQMPPGPGAGDALKLVQVKADETGYQLAAIGGLTGMETGDIKTTIRKSAEPVGWLFCSGKTIGSATSGATARANADTQNLFILLWDEIANTELPIQDSGGVPTTRGASGAADFAANKRMPLPDIRGRVIAGRDDMGGVTASRLTGAGAGIIGVTNGASGGAQTHVLAVAEIQHKHPIPHQHEAGDGKLDEGIFNTNQFLAGTIVKDPATGVLRVAPVPDGAGTDFTSVKSTVGGNSEQPTIANTSDLPATTAIAHQNTQPTYILNFIIKL